MTMTLPTTKYFSEPKRGSANGLLLMCSSSSPAVAVSNGVLVIFFLPKIFKFLLIRKLGTDDAEGVFFDGQNTKPRALSIRSKLLV